MINQSHQVIKPLKSSDSGNGDADDDEFMAFDRRNEEEESEYDRSSFVMRPAGYRGPVRWSAYSSDTRSLVSGSSFSRGSMVSRVSRGTANQKCILCLNEPVGPDYPFTSFQFMPCSHIFCIGCTKEKFQALIIRK